MSKENIKLYFYAVCLEYVKGEYYYRYETHAFPCVKREHTYMIEKYPGCPFYLDSTYKENALDRIHGTENHWYAYVVTGEPNEPFAKELLAKELERRNKQALDIANAGVLMLKELDVPERDIER